MVPTYHYTYRGRGGAEFLSARVPARQMTPEARQAALERTLKDFRGCLDLDPRCFEAWLGRAEAELGIAAIRFDKKMYVSCFEQADFMFKAEKWFDETFDDIDRSMILQARARSRQGLGDLAGALADYDECIRLAPCTSLYHDNRARCHERNGRPDLGLVDRVIADMVKDLPKTRVPGP